MKWLRATFIHLRIVALKIQKLIRCFLARRNIRDERLKGYLNEDPEVQIYLDE